MYVGWAGVALNIPNRLALLPPVVGGEETVDREVCIDVELSISIRLGCGEAAGGEVGAA